MYCLNLKGERVEIVDVKNSQLPMVVKWYNQIQEYGYATGIEVPITLQEMMRKYHEYLQSEEVFFACIYKVSSKEIIGIIKGIIKKGKEDAIWINSIFILDKFQNNGFGKDSIFLIFNKIKKEKSVKNAYLSVACENIRGISFWEKMGFLQWGERARKPLPDGNTIEVIIMCREI